VTLDVAKFTDDDDSETILLSITGRGGTVVVVGVTTVVLVSTDDETELKIISETENPTEKPVTSTAIPIIVITFFMLFFINDKNFHIQEIVPPVFPHEK